MKKRLLGAALKASPYVVDLAAMSAAFYFAYLLRFDFKIPQPSATSVWLQLPYVVLLQMVVLMATGVYRFVWRYIGLAEVDAFVRAAFFSAIPLVAMRLLLPDAGAQWRVPLSVIVMNSFLGFSAILVLRVLRRIHYESSEKRRRALLSKFKERRGVLLVGAGRLGVQIVREIRSRRDLGLDVVGFVDDDQAKSNSSIEGVRVLGSSRDIPQLARRLRVDHVVITVRRSAPEIRRIVDICEGANVRARIVPALSEALEDGVELSRIRDVEIEDLLGRQVVDLDEPQVRALFADRRVVVTGAGGSIGSELCRQVAFFEPRSLIALDQAEFALFEVERKLRASFPLLDLVAVVADVMDRQRLHAVFSAHTPDIVLHAAAHKHVPMMETNPSEAIKNNILGTRTVGEVAGTTGVDTFVLISTDKAVRPTSMMGASKRVAELVVQDLNRLLPTRFLAVRFGNVLGSAGSVVQIFREQIRAGGPVTVTHPRITRYFMTVAEASQLVLQAAALGEGGQILTLDMGEPVLIVDLAKDMIRLSGLKPYEDVDIVFTGLRPGEKLYEELELDGEEMAATRHPKIFVGLLNGVDSDRLDFALRRLAELADEGDAEALREFLNELLPESQLKRTTRSARTDDDWAGTSCPG